jgi:hypothetical protein
MLLTQKGIARTKTNTKNFKGDFRGIAQGKFVVATGLFLFTSNSTRLLQILVKNPVIPFVTVSGTSYRNDVNLRKGRTEWRESGSKEWEYSSLLSYS